VTTSYQRKQARWPVEFMTEFKVSLPQTFGKLKPYEKELKTWYFSNPKDHPIGLSNARLDEVIGQTTIKAIQEKYKVSQADAYDAVRQFVLRTFTYVSRDGGVPNPEKIERVADLIKEKQLTSVFPSSERPGELWEIGAALSR
jgi:hypothetical protein